MDIRKCVVRVATGAACFVLAAPSFGATCSNTITNESIKMQNTIVKEFLKCNDAYRKDQTNKNGPGTPPFGKAATSCEKELSTKVLGISGVLAKEISKLQSKVTPPKGTPVCKDADLLALGQLDQTNFPGRMSQGVGMTALSLAFQEIADSVQDWGKMIQDMIDSGNCADCAKFRVPPCVGMTCNFLANGEAQSSVGLATPGGGTAEIPVPLNGISTLGICDATQFISGADNVLFVVGVPGKQLAPATVLTQKACVTQISGNGIIVCSGSNNAVAYESCQDHNIPAPTAAGATTSGTCSGNSCQASSTDKKVSSVINGGACFKATVSAASEGDAFINVTNNIRLSNAPGTDGIFCTPDDDYAAPETGASATPFTTRTANATVKNVDNQSGVSIDTTGFSSPGIKFPSCARIRQGDLTGGAQLVGAFPALNTLTAAKVDSVTFFFLTCN